MWIGCTVISETKNWTTKLEAIELNNADRITVKNKNLWFVKFKGLKKDVLLSTFTHSSKRTAATTHNIDTAPPINHSSKWIIYSLVNRGNSKNVITEDDAKKDAEFVGSTGQDEDREAARAIQETLHTKANDHLTFGYFEKAIINFHQAIKKGISNS